MASEITSVPRKRRRPSSSPGASPRGDGDGDAKRRRTDLTVDVCRDFVRSVCRRSQIDCKFAHPHSAVSIERDKVVACADSLRSKCFRGRTCRYYHPPAHIQELLLKALGVEDPKVDMVCRDFIRGRCLRAAKECRFSHHTTIDDSAIVCQDFLRGKCERKSCRYSHVPAYATSQVHMQQYAMPMKLPRSPPRSENDQEILEVCRDFLKKMCNRDSCKYAHPDSKTRAAKSFVERALQYSKDLVIENGLQGPFDHLFKLNSHDQNARRKPRFDANNLVLYAVTDSGMNQKWGRSITDAIKAAIEGGATIVQLREKEVATREFVEAAKACMEVCRSYGVPLLINDRVDVALASDADGVHVDQSDMPARMARTILGPEKIIGVSCKNPAEAEQAWADGADYIGCGGVFSTTTKANNPTVGLDGLKTVCLTSKLPVVAIGGIDAGNASSVMELTIPSLKGVAVVSALFDRECIVSEAQKLRSILMDVASVSIN